MKPLAILLISLLCTVPCMGFFSAFVVMTPDAGKGQAEFQPWLYHPLEDSDTVIVAVPHHQGDKKYWLVKTTRELAENELNLRSVIQLGSRPLPAHIESVSKLSAYESLGEPEAGEDLGVIYVRIRREALNEFYIVHDFPTGVDDGGYYRTYQLSAYPIDSFGVGQDKMWQFFEARRKPTSKEVDPTDPPSAAPPSPSP